MRRISSVIATLVAVGAIAATAQTNGDCSTVELEAASSTGEASSSVEEELMRRIQLLAEGRSPRPLAYRRGGDGDTIEVPGLRCPASMRYVASSLLEGDVIELVFGEDRVLRLTAVSVSEVVLDEHGELHIALARAASKKLAELTRTYARREMSVRVNGNEVERIPILGPISSGRLLLRNTGISASELGGVRLAVSVRPKGCVPGCSSSYVWEEDGTTFSYSPNSER